jgi:hypothetical protein
MVTMVSACIVMSREIESIIILQQNLTDKNSSSFLIIYFPCVGEGGFLRTVRFNQKLSLCQYDQNI